MVVGLFKRGLLLPPRSSCSLEDESLSAAAAAAVQVPKRRVEGERRGKPYLVYCTFAVVGSPPSPSSSAGASNSPYRNLFKLENGTSIIRGTKSRLEALLLKSIVGESLSFSPPRPPLLPRPISLSPQVTYSYILLLPPLEGRKFPLSPPPRF